MNIVFCRGCGKEIHKTAQVCTHCVAPQVNPSNQGKANNQNYVDKSSVSKFNKLLMAIYIVGAILTVVVGDYWTRTFFILATPFISYILYNLSDALGMGNNKKIIFAVLGLIPIVNFITSIFLNIKAAKLLKSA